MRYMEKKVLVRQELLKCATAKPMEFPTYGEFGPRVGIPTQGPWQPVLDAIANEDDEAGEPDITFVIRSKRTGYPSRVGRVTKRDLTFEQKKLARKIVQEVIDRYNPGTLNPYLG